MGWGDQNRASASFTVHRGGIEGGPVYTRPSRRVRRLISFSLWGTHPRYTAGAVENLRLAPEIYSGWAVRYYVDETVPRDIVSTLRSGGAEIIDMTGSKFPALFWRFLPMDDDSVDVFIVRDTDSRLSAREFHAVREWLDSGKRLHVMRDHPQHGAVMLGGMWGFRKPSMQGLEIRRMIESFAAEQQSCGYASDQTFLQRIYAMFRSDALVHDEFFTIDEHRRAFPTKRVGDEFVGSIYVGVRNLRAEGGHRDLALALLEAEADRRGSPFRGRLRVWWTRSYYLLRVRVTRLLRTIGSRPRTRQLPVSYR